MYQPAVKRLFDHLQPSQVPNVASLLAQALIHRIADKRSSRKLGCRHQNFSKTKSSPRILRDVRLLKRDVLDRLVRVRESMLLEVAQLGDGLTPVEVRILPPPLVYPRLKLPHFYSPNCR